MSVIYYHCMLRTFDSIDHCDVHTQALEVTVWRDGKEYKQHYSRGKPITMLTSITLSGETSSRQGTHIRFWPDKDSKLLFLQRISLV